MELDFEGPLADRAYPILASLVVPRPIALVTTISPAGKVNAAPFSFFNVLGAEPPILAVAPGDRDDGTPKDTARNVRATHEFVVNLVDEAIAEAMNQCAAPLPFGESELRPRGLHPRIVGGQAAAHRGGSREPRVCGVGHPANRRQPRHHRPDQARPPARRTVRHGIATGAHRQLHTIGRMASPHWYCKTRDRFEMIRPG